MKTSVEKFTRLKGNELRVSFKDIISRKEFFYAARFVKRPTTEERRDYLNQVLSNCGFLSTNCLKPIKW